MAMNQQDLSRGVNAFGTSLFTHLDADARSGSATFLSPWGIAHALAMLLEGAPSNTAAHQQILNVVFSSKAASSTAADTSGEAVRSAIQALTASIISSNDDSLTVDDANSAWVKPDLQLLDTYVNALKTYYSAQASPLTGAEVVNTWVEEKTNGKIKTIIDEGVAAEADLILCNAIYFKGLWQASFDTQDTARYPFMLMDGSKMDVPMMYLSLKKGNAVHGATFHSTMPDGSSLECVAVKMKYQGGAYSAVISMPLEQVKEPVVAGSKLVLESGKDYATALVACREGLISALSSSSDDGTAAAAALQWKTIGDPKIQAVKVYLPRFEIEYGTSLSSALKAAGLQALFRPGDFSKMTSEGDLGVSDVVHKVYVKVDEAGTEAAAATAVVMMRMAAMRPPPELFVKFDKPFVFTVVHEETGLALFAGEVFKPELWK